MGDRLLLTTQPGWAFATLAELRARGVRQRVDFFHRDSTLVVPFEPALARQRLLTAEDVGGLVVAATSTTRADATERLRRLLSPGLLGESALRWLARPLSDETGRATTQSRRYSVEVEVWGETALHRHALADVVRQAVRGAFPNWKEATHGGVRILCKADPRAAVLGIQLYSTLAAAPHHTERARLGSVRSGTLREHLACGLLTLARVGQADAVLDPFMGTGTILRSAAERFDVRVCIGAEVDAAAYREARRMIRADRRLRHGSFEEIDFDTLPHSVKLVSNLPFGVQFTQIPTRRLLAFLNALWPRLQAVALLMSREQARVVAEALPLRIKHVLVLGQPAAIVYSWGRERISGRK